MPPLASHAPQPVATAATMTATPAAGGGGAVDGVVELLAILLAETGARGGSLAGVEIPASPLEGASGPVCEYELDGELRLALVAPARPPDATVLRLASLALGSTLETAQLRARVARLMHQASATLEVNRTIGNAQDLDQLLTLVAQRCRELLHCEIAGFALLEDRENAIIWRAMSGCRTDVYRRVSYHPDRGIAGRAMTSGRPVVMRDFLSEPGIDPDEFPISFAEGVRSALGVPLQIAGRARGCLMICYRSVRAFTSEEIDALTSFAAQAAIAVENAELYDRLRREQARLESVVQSMNEGLVLIDLEDRVAYLNKQAHDLFALDRRDWLGVRAHAFIDHLIEQTADPRRTRAELLAIERSPVEFPSLDVELARPLKRDVRLTCFTVYDVGGQRLGRGYLCRDITFEKQVDAMKTEVISVVSHEIRTPLAAIRGYASALLDHTRRRTGALQLEYLQMIDSESARLDELVRNLTDVSKLDAGVLFLDMNEISPTHLLRRVVARWKKVEPRRRLHFAEGAREVAPIRMDHRRIEQVLDNLTSNAVKYSAAGSTIRLRLTEDADAVTISVSDEGVGIAPEKRDRVFDRFYRIETGRRKGDGSGLGLYIARGIVAAHGGRIWLESSEGEGTTVFFSLPKTGGAQVG